MIDLAQELLRDNRVMSIATLMEDGSPHCTMVAYANDGFDIFFVVSKHGRKFANMRRDDRVSIAIGRDVLSPKSIKGLAISARAQEVTDEKARDKALDLMFDRRPPFEHLDRPRSGRAAVMKAVPELISVIDYSQGFGHSSLLKVAADGSVEEVSEANDDWGFGADLKPTS